LHTPCTLTFAVSRLRGNPTLEHALLRGPDFASSRPSRQSDPEAARS
jgi:hypothetical protein